MSFLTIQCARVAVLAAVLFALAFGANAAQRDPRLDEAESFIQRGLAGEAVPLLEAILADSPGNAEAHLILASAHAIEGQRSRALRAVIRAMELNPSDARAHEMAGGVLFRLGENDSAARAFDQAIVLDPSLGSAHLSLALIEAGRGHLDRAAGLMAKAIQLQPDAAKRGHLHFLNGKLSVERDRLEEAAREFERSVELDPENAEARLALGVALKRLLRDDEAFAALSDAVRLAPANPRARYHLGLELMRQGSPAEAAEHLRAAHDRSPGRQAVLYNLTRALHRAGRLDEAARHRAALDRMIRDSDQARENELVTAKMHSDAVRLEGAGDYAAAVDKYRSVLEVEPFNATARRNLGLALCRLGRWDEGIRELRDVLAENSDDADLARTLSIALDQAAKASEGAGGDSATDGGER